LAYDSEAQEFVYGFFARGWSKERALPAVRKVYPGFAGSTWDEWVKKLNWAQRRALADAKLRDFQDLCRDTTRLLLLELNEIREKLLAVIRGDKLADNQTVYAYTSVCKQIAELSKQHLANQDPQKVALEVINSVVEKLLGGLRGINGLARPLEEHAGEVGKLITEISEEFGREM
jgi:hypothetical protein